MIEDFAKIYEKLVDSDAYKQFQRDHEGYYLAHGFVQLDNKYEAAKDWQLGFYSIEKDNLAVFETNTPKLLSFDEAFKDGGTISELKFDKDKFVTTQFALEYGKNLLAEKYKGELVMNVIVILQVIGEQPTYNLTFITQAFSMITIHVDALSGEIKKEVKNSVLDLKKQ